MQSVRYWRHRITLPDGTVTQGTQDTVAQLPLLGIPDDLSGKTVLDIGCSDGFFAFECERRGASRVVGLDNFSSVYVDSPSGFHVARQLLNSKVELVEGDFMTIDLKSLGQFDLVLFLGVLYHLRHPMLAIERLAEITKEHVILETVCTRPRTGWKWRLLSRLAGDALPSRFMTFVGPRNSNDPTNWWFQSVECVEEMMRACGFCAVRSTPYDWTRGVFHGSSPRHGGEVDELMSRCGSKAVRNACRAIAGNDAEPRTLSISQFGAVAQMAAELRSKELVQQDREKR